MKIQNISKRKQAIVGVPQFESMEIREVSINEAEKLLANPNFKEVKAEKETIKEIESDNESINAKATFTKKDKIK